MRFRVVISARAERDLHEIVAYLSGRSALAAERWIEAFEGAVGSLAEMPRRFPRAVEGEGLVFEVRQTMVGPFRVIFSVEGREVVVLHVRHAARRELEGL